METRVKISEVCCLCYGAKRALTKSVEAKKEGKNVVLFKEILHNKRVVQELQKLNIVEKENLEDLQKGDFVILRAHGEGKGTYRYLDSRNIEYLDCTCPNVLSINKLVEKKNSEGYKIILIGKYGYKTGKIHPEVLGTSNWCDSPILIEEEEEIDTINLASEKYFLAVQTTFSQEKALKMINKISKKMQQLGKKFEFKDTTCNAQRVINEKSVKLAKEVDKMIVVGGKNSSNTKELFNNVSTYTTSFFVESIDDVKVLIKDKKIVKGDYIGLTGGASTIIEELNEIRDYIVKVL